MPKGINISSPPRFVGEPETQIGQMHTWLFQLVEQLNVAMNVVQAQDGAAAQDGQGANGERGGAVTAEEMNNQRDQLKSLIIKTADIVRVEMQREIKRLESISLALSDFGEYREEISREIEDTASGTVESYAASIGLENYIKDSADLKEWQAETNGYIRKGFIYRSETNIPVLGIAIGQNITTKEVTADGLEQLEISNQNMGFFTSEGLEFYVNGLRVAFFRNDGMEINNATITGRLRIGNWEISHSNGLEIKWIGGE